MTTIDYTLSSGAHESRDAGMCAMEWVAFIAGEPHSDQPKCVSPVLKSFCISFNDALPDDQRQRLRPYLTRCIGTANDGLDEQRAWMATDWLIRECIPAWLDLAGLHTHAQNLRSLGRILSSKQAREVQPQLNAARVDAAAARDAARDAARAAARAAAWDAARDAARDAAGDAAWAAAGSKKFDVEAFRSAVYDAAFAKLKPTSSELIDSAFGLLDRMLPTATVELPPVMQAEYDRLCAA